MAAQKNQIAAKMDQRPGTNHVNQGGVFTLAVIRDLEVPCRSGQRVIWVRNTPRTKTSRKRDTWVVHRCLYNSVESEHNC